MSWIDIVIIVLTAICALLGLKKGLFRSIKSFFGFFLSFVAAVLLSKAVALQLLKIEAIQNLVFDTIFNWLNGWIGGIVPEGGFVYNLISPLVSGITPYVAEGEMLFSEGVALYFSFGIACVIATLALFIILRIIFAIVFKIIDGFISSPSPSALSRLLGFVAGAAKGLLYTVSLLILMIFLSSGIPALGSFDTEMRGSTIGGAIVKVIDNVSDTIAANSDGDTFEAILESAENAGFVSKA